MAKQRIASMEYVMSADAAKLLTELERVRRETTKMRKTVEDSSDRIKYAFNKLRRAAQVVASAFIFAAGIRSLTNLVLSVERAEERLQLMQARLAQFGRSGETFSVVYKQAKELGVSIDDVAEGMTRLFVATKNIGTTEEDIARVQRNIILLGRAGGTSAEEMKGGMRQLSQGLASNRLAGEELRSVLENFPLVAYEIADALGIGIGQIREFGAAGKISADIVIEALKEIEVDVSKLPDTFSMAMERVSTEWDLLLAAMGKKLESSGMMEWLDRAFKNSRILYFGDYTGFDKEQLRAEFAAQQKIVNEAAQNKKAKNIPLHIRRMYLDLYDQEVEKLNRINEALLAIAEAERKAAKEKAALGIAATIQPDVDALIADKQLKEFKIVDPYERLQEAWQRINKEVDDYYEKIAQTANMVRGVIETPAENFIRLMREARQTIGKEGGLTQEELDKYRDHLLETFDVIKDEGEKTNNIAEELGLTFASAFEDAIVQARSLREIVNAMLQDIIRIGIRKSITEPLGNAVSGFFSSIFGGPKALGGPVYAGTGYLVGERGPELFMPAQSGVIVPNHALAGAGGVNISYAIDARGADEATIIAKMIPLLEKTVEFTKNSVRKDIREGRLT